MVNAPVGLNNLKTKADNLGADKLKTVCADLKKLRNFVSKEDLTFNSATCNLGQKWNNYKFQLECKKYCTFKKDYSWNLSTYICDNGRYLKSIFYTSVTVYNKNYKCYRQCINKCYTNKSNEYCFNNFWW